MSRKKKEKKIAVDMLLNVSAAAIPMMILQLVVYPVLSRYIEDEEYGLMISMYSLWMMISNTLGNVIFNVRLINNNIYEEKGLQGDFLPLLNVYGLINTIIILAATIYFNHGVDSRHLVFSLIIATVIYMKAYLDVGYRLVIDYVAVTVSACFVGVGFLIGCLFSLKAGIWELVFLFGYGCGCLYAVKKTGLLKEKNIRTTLFNDMKKDTEKLTIATVAANLTTYADKMVVFPIMGGAATAIYYNASILGKVVGMVTGPVSGVILTYLAKKNNSDRKQFGKILAMGVLITSVAYVAVVAVARPVMGVLYPQWVDDIMEYVPVTTINVCLLALISMMNPFVLRFCDLKWQILINGMGAAIYFIAALMLWRSFGLLGFCIGTVVGSFARLLLIIYTYYYYTREEAI